MSPEQKVKFLKAAWDAIGSEFGSRHTLRWRPVCHPQAQFPDVRLEWSDKLMSTYGLGGELDAGH